MTDQELQQQRTDLWRLDPEKPLRTMEDAKEFFDSVGFALLYPSRSVLIPSFIGAYLSSEENARDRKKAAADPRLKDALELADRMVRDQVVFEVATERGRLLVSAAEFPYFYALLGDRNPKQAFHEGVHGEKRLQGDTLHFIESNGPSTKEELVVALSKGISESAMDRTLSELTQSLRAVRVPQQDGPDRFDLLYRFAPQAVNEGKGISTPEALSAIVARYLETVVAAEQKQIEDFVGLVSARSRVSEVIKALTGAGEFAYAYIGEANLLRVSSSIKPEPKKPYVPKPKFAREDRPARDGEDSAERPKRFDRAEKRGFGDRPRFERDGDRGRGDRPFKPRREFTPREGGEAGERPSYRDRPSYPRRDAAGSERGYRPGTRFGGTRPAAGEGGRDEERPRRSFGDRGDRSQRPYQRREGSEDRPRRTFSDRGDRPFKRRDDGDRPFGDRPKRPFRPREDERNERPKRSFSGGDRPSRPYQKREGDGDRPRRSFGDGERPKRSFSGDDRPSRPYQKREGDNDRPRRSFGDGERPKRSFGGGDRTSRPYQKREGDGAERPKRSFAGGDRPRRSFGERPPREGSDRPRRDFRSDDRPPRDRGERSASSGTGEKRPFKAGGFGKKPFGKKPFGAAKGPGGFKKFGKPAGKSGGKFGKPAFDKAGARPPRKPRRDEGGEE